MSVSSKFKKVTTEWLLHQHNGAKTCPDKNQKLDMTNGVIHQREGHMKKGDYVEESFYYGGKDFKIKMALF